MTVSSTLRFSPFFGLVLFWVALGIKHRASLCVLVWGSPLLTCIPALPSRSLVGDISPISDLVVFWRHQIASEEVCVWEDLISEVTLSKFQALVLFVLFSCCKSVFLLEYLNSVCRLCSSHDVLHGFNIDLGFVQHGASLHGYDKTFHLFHRTLECTVL